MLLFPLVWQPPWATVCQCLRQMNQEMGTWGFSGSRALINPWDVCVPISLANHSYSFTPLTASVTLPSANISLAQIPCNHLGNQLMVFSMENSIYFTIKLLAAGMALLNKQNWKCVQKNISLSELHITSQILDNRGSHSPNMWLQCNSPYKSNNVLSTLNK